MTLPLTEFLERYRSGLESYLGGGGEHALEQAYALGRTALAGGLGVLEMAALHHEAILAVLPRASEETGHIVKTAEVFFAQSLSPFEMTLRGFREANATLNRLNEALETEIRRIAHEIHDEAGQLLTSVHLALSEVSGDLPPPARLRLREVRRLLNGIEDHLRRISHELRPVILDDLGLVPALRFLAESVSMRTGMSITVEASTDGRLPPVMEATLYRVVQEGLTNVTKHAQANQATILLQQEAREIRCAIRDDGVGFDVPAVLARRGKRSLGLIGMHERLASLGGTHQITSAPGRGTELLFRIPLGGLECRSGFSLPTTTSLSARA